MENNSKSPEVPVKPPPKKRGRKKKSELALIAANNELNTNNIINVLRVDLLEVRGKRTCALRKVFILLTPDMVNGLNYLAQTRKQVGISSRNNYMFARRSCVTPLDGCTSIKEQVDDCPGLGSPEAIRSRSLRKYLATTLQVTLQKQKYILSCTLAGQVI